MVASIVVPLDGSEPAEVALEPGLALASGFGSELVLVRATWHRPPDEEQRYLQGIVDKLGYGNSRCLTVHGFADSKITELVSGMSDAVLCLSTHGHSGIGAIILGSVAREMLDRTLGQPLVLVGPSYGGTSIGERDGGTLVFCFDGSPAATELEPTVARWAALLRLRVRVVTVLHRDGEYLGDIAADDVRFSADEVVERLQAGGLNAEGVVLASLDPARAITEDAAACGAALIAAGATSTLHSKGAARLSRAVLGGTAERIVRHTQAPVLVLRG